MAASNHLILAVAGSRKTQGIVDACAASDPQDRILILTYTTTNQSALRSRLAGVAGGRPNIEVMGWFSFLINHIVRPYLPFMFATRRVRGFDFKSPPMRGTRTDSVVRYMNADGVVYKVHLPQLALLVEEASGGAGIKRLSRLYDRIFIDEVQDLCGYDLEILRLLMASELPLELVGDVRQAVLATNERESKNKKFMYMQVWHWFQAEAKKGSLTISQRNTTWRCRPEIAAFADTLFGTEWGFEATESLNNRVTDHDGLFLVRSCDIRHYVNQFRPTFLRHSKRSGRGLEHEFMNYKISKGLTRQRILILPTEPIIKLLQRGEPLAPQQAAELYVAVTRAEQSVALVMDVPGGSPIQYWSPAAE